MTSLADLLQQGGASALLFIPTVMLLGALHGLEPGHSKTLMAAFIIAVRGTIGQAVLLGLAATVSHTAVVWVVALGGMYYFSNLNADNAEPYFQVASAVLIIAIAAWMLYRTWREQRELKAARLVAEQAAKARPTLRQVDTGHGIVGLDLQRDEGIGAARFRLATLSGDAWAADDVSIATTAADGRRRVYRMVARDGQLESADAVPEPHLFTATITFTHGDHEHDYDVAFTAQDAAAVVDEPMDAHSRAHANDIKKRFANRSVTTGQILMFGLTGGLIPCPAAITVLLLCLQVKKIALSDGGDGRWRLVFNEAAPPIASTEIQAIGRNGQCHPLKLFPGSGAAEVFASGPIEKAYRVRVALRHDDHAHVRDLRLPGTEDYPLATGPHGGTLISMGHDSHVEVLAQADARWRISFFDRETPAPAPATADVIAEAIAEPAVRELKVLPGDDRHSLFLDGKVGDAGHLRLAVMMGDHYHTRCVPVTRP
jgi:nickel/cobalt exporter